MGVIAMTTVKDTTPAPGLNLLTNDGAAALASVSRRTLPVWRVQGKGPKFIKIGRLVRYSEADVIAWIEENKRTSTSATSAPAV
ncbi:helix-turn-helix domain-containing protein [uncultured Rhodoferax sp.]|uniref:helix-turn-helix transcriptional regulator n=1 Tax=uncultured Rhodoferax sp. TaxID=223188 RepID=UPI003446F0E2